ncbi:LamG domain-containing protein [Phragmitibacter flavus]|uniref:LamG domain-containing protein n=1 Tax=Phragmitibacter flavus TaxID=2576071 RepID=A0A5R8KGI5_9BACT|nr:LamG domain-containing protein [Phragmitibacter flavus]TLD71414.1 LamG domain-containing protein [Phragmitibacter flavus]
MKPFPITFNTSRIAAFCSTLIGLLLVPTTQAATVLYYQFGGTAGSNATSVTDSSGNNLTGTGSSSGTGAVLPQYNSSTPGLTILDGLNGPVINSNNTTSVKFENAGVNDATPVYNTGRGGRIAVTSPLFEPVDSTTPFSFTLEMFVRVEDNVQFASLAGKERNGGPTWLLDTNNVGNAAPNVESIDSQLRLRVDHQVLANTSGDGFNQNIGSNSNGLFGDGEWHHVAITFDDSTNTFTFYKDYALAGSGQISAVGVQDLVYNGGAFFLGNAGGGRAFDGWMDEVRFSNSILTTDQFLRAIPEPMTASLLIIGATSCLLRRQRARDHKLA